LRAWALREADRIADWPVRCPDPVRRRRPDDGVVEVEPSRWSGWNSCR